MSTISVSLPSDGSVADVSDYNTPITTIVNEINGGLNNANIASGAAIATAKLAADNGITGSMISSSAITLGYAELTTSFSTANQTATQVTGTVNGATSSNFSVTVTIPTGTRKIRISVYAPSVGVNAVAANNIGIWDGTVGSGTLLTSGVFTSAGVSYVSPMNVSAVVAPASGSKTYNVSYHVQSNTGTIGAAAQGTGTGPAYLIVEAL